ncbi:TOM13-domain-containing protein, partial [Suhomyces tanzawaensis NRRL Y-17324]
VLSSQDTTDFEELLAGLHGEVAVPQHLVSFSVWDILKKSAINLVLPFINGIMLGFGEILAHEIGFRYNFVGARVQPPRRLQKRQESRFL